MASGDISAVVGFKAPPFAGATYSVTPTVGTVPNAVGCVMLCVGIYGAGEDPVSAPTWGGAAMTLFGSYRQSGAETRKIFLYYKTGISAGSPNVVVDYNGVGIGGIAGAAFVVEGLNQTTPFTGTVATGAGSNTSATVSVTSSNGSIVLGLACAQSSVVSSIGGSETLVSRQDNSNFGTYDVNAVIVTKPSTTSSTTLTETITASSNWTMMGADMMLIGGGAPALLLARRTRYGY